MVPDARAPVRARLLRFGAQHRGVGDHLPLPAHDRKNSITQADGRQARGTASDAAGRSAVIVRDCPARTVQIAILFNGHQERTAYQLLRVYELPQPAGAVWY